MPAKQASLGRGPNATELARVYVTFLQSVISAPRIRLAVFVEQVEDPRNCRNAVDRQVEIVRHGKDSELIRVLLIKPELFGGNQMRLQRTVFKKWWIRSRSRASNPFQMPAQKFSRLLVAAFLRNSNVGDQKFEDPLAI